jgi:hypothetical protein
MCLPNFTEGLVECYKRVESAILRTRLLNADVFFLTPAGKCLDYTHSTTVGEVAADTRRFRTFHGLENPLELFLSSFGRQSDS